MNAPLQDQTTHWLRTAPRVPGLLVRGIRFADETFVADGDVQDFAANGLEAAWRVMADAFQVLRAQHLPPTRLTWVYERTILYCAQRADGAVLGMIVAKSAAAADSTGLDRLLREFQTQSAPPL